MTASTRVNMLKEKKTLYSEIYLNFNLLFSKYYVWKI